MKKLLAILFAVSMMSCDPAALQQVLGSIGNAPLTNAEISSGLKEALEVGISKGAQALSQKGGYFDSPYRILLPPEARKITEKLSVIPGFSNVEQVILEKINRGAEDAAKRAKPIFVNAIKSMTFNDALNILMGERDAATGFLKNATYNALYNEFNPVIVNSLDKFNARKYWSDVVGKYNAIPFVEKLNPNLDDYVTTEALNGLFGMVQKEEANIRTNISARTTDLLKRVFAKQDK